ncbi:hypothetical protein L1987_45816 [Smallanthus sonchifolius]|uniref:Uncharacterized protein n=1 Tax=Smallanthus sonchifolius TaxID=185202 RepID=A0ACB9FZ11_9ASTR|nr:hypothetical protein L1987_45816 [Smallanthus sonchifolius]
MFELTRSITDDDLDDEEGGDEEKGNNESEEEDDDEKEVEYDVVEDEVVEERLVEDEVIDNEEVRDEVVANKENAEVVMDENVVENIPEETETEKDENDVEKLLASVPFLQIGHPTKKDDINQEKRLKTLSQALKSPYVNRKVAMGEKMTTTETLVTNYIFKDTDASKYEIVFQSSITGNDFYKVVFESFYPNVQVVANALDAFSELLNFEEQKRSLDSKFRLYGTCTMLKKTACAYLDTIGCNICKTMEISEIKRVEMTCRTLNN